MKNDNSALKRFNTLIFAIYILLYLVISLSMAFKQPFGNPPDETYRYKISYYVYEHHALPNGYDEQIRIPGYGFSYGFQPILPYMMQGAVMIVADAVADFGESLFYVARLTDCLLGLIMAIVVWKLSKLWFEKESAAYLFAFLVTFLPQAIFLHTYINTESCAMLSTAIILYALTLGIKDDFKVKTCVLLAVGVILCTLSYYNAYGFILSAVMIFAAWNIKVNDSGKTFFDAKAFWTKGLLIAGIVLAGAAWWFVRSAVLYDGDFLGLTARAACGEMYGDPTLMQEGMVLGYKKLGLSLADLLFTSDFCMISMNTFICAYGSTTILTSMWIYRLYKLLFIAGLFMCLLPRAAVKEYVSRFGNEKRPKLSTFFLINLLLCIFISISLSVMYSYNTEFQPQGRYVMPMLLPFMYFVVRGALKGVALITKIIAGIWKKKTDELLYEKACNIIFMSVAALIALSIIVTVYLYAFPEWESITRGL